MSQQLSLENIRLGYSEIPVIQDFDLAIQSGSFIGLLGPNGAGKSTLLLAIGGQFRPDTGLITYKNKDIYANNIWYKRRVGYVHEAPYLYPRLTVTEFLRFIAGIKGIGDKETDKTIAKLIHSCQLSDQRVKLCSELSMGMRKKLLIAAALLGQPEVVLLDEALNGVDFESAYHIKNLLMEFVSDGGIVILSSHVLEVVEKLCNRFLLLKNGRLIADLGVEALGKVLQKSDSKSLGDYLIEILKP